MLPSLSPTTAPAPRTYSVRYQRDLTGYGHHWRLVTNGAGHWCRADNHVSRFSSETAAHAAGRRWVATGRAA